MSSNTTYSCDVNRHTNHDLLDEMDTKVRNGVALPVVMTTETNEGRSVKAYLTRETMDICERHYQYMVNNREIISGGGAQGYNDYWFDSEKIAMESKLND